MSKLPFVLRVGRSEDQGFILRSWMRCLRGAPMRSGVPEPDYDHAQHELCEARIAHSVVLVAADPDSLLHLHGAIIFDTAPSYNVLHWLYVPSDYRGAGIARELFAEMRRRGASDRTYWTQPYHGWVKRDESVSFQEVRRRERATLARYGVVPYPYLLMGIGPREQTYGT